MSDELNNTGEQILQEAAVPQESANATQPDQDRQVPLAALESERAKRQRLEEENRMMREHFSLMQAQVAQPTKNYSKDDLESLDDGDVVTVGELKKISSKIKGEFQGTLEELRMQQKYPDYQEVITKHLPEVIKQNPSLRTALQKTQDYELAYYLAKNSDSYKTLNQKFERNVDAERIIKNTSQSGTLSSMGASTPVAQAKRYKDMSDAEFRETVHKNLGY